MVINRQIFYGKYSHWKLSLLQNCWFRIEGHCQTCSSPGIKSHRKFVRLYPSTSRGKWLPDLAFGVLASRAAAQPDWSSRYFDRRTGRDSKPARTGVGAAPLPLAWNEFWPLPLAGKPPFQNRPTHQKPTIMPRVCEGEGLHRGALRLNADGGMPGSSKGASLRLFEMLAAIAMVQAGTIELSMRSKPFRPAAQRFGLTGRSRSVRYHPVESTGPC